MKRLFIILLALLMALASSSAVFAETTEGTTGTVDPSVYDPCTGTTEVTYTVDESYTWSIPSSTELNTSAYTELTNNITIYGLIDSGKQVDITVNSLNEWKVAVNTTSTSASSDDGVAYQLININKEGSPVVTQGASIGTLVSGSNTVASDKLIINLKGIVTGTALKSGVHNDFLTFTATYGDQN